MSLGSWIPPVDIVEEKDRILLTAELPGFKENEIEIQMEGGVLTLRGERKSETEKEGRTFHRMERSYGQFVRSFTLPNNVDRDHVKANFANGVLEIELPKREEAKPRQIKITPGSGNGGKKETIDVKRANDPDRAGRAPLRPMRASATRRTWRGGQALCLPLRRGSRRGSWMLSTPACGMARSPLRSSAREKTTAAVLRLLFWLSRFAAAPLLAAPLPSRRSEIVEVVEKVAPAVVNIAAEQTVRRARSMFDDVLLRDGPAARPSRSARA